LEAPGRVVPLEEEGEISYLDRIEWRRKTDLFDCEHKYVVRALCFFGLRRAGTHEELRVLFIVVYRSNGGGPLELRRTTFFDLRVISRLVEIHP
jgi:hypothetical protein